jgi:curved DNA-binding protein
MAARSDTDLYATLGVDRNDDEDTIRKAYRKLARQYHPDVNPGDTAAEERFKEISAAYAVLSDEEKRRNYDEFGEVSLESGFDPEAARHAREQFGARFGGDPQGAHFGGDGEFSFGDLDGLFGRIFSRGGGRIFRRGRDLEAVIELDFLDAARGGEHQLSFSRPSADGSLHQQRMTVRIPAGVSDGGRIRLAGKGGEAPPGGEPGDVHLTVRIRPHPEFRREGRDLLLTVPIGVGEAVLGAKIEIPTLEGRATVTVPAGTDSGRVLRLRGKGIPDPAGGATGDLLVTLEIRVPKDLSPEDRARFEEISRLDAPDLRKEPRK